MTRFLGVSQYTPLPGCLTQHRISLCPWSQSASRDSLPFTDRAANKPALHRLLTALAVTVTFQLGGNLRSHAIQPLSLLSCLAAGHHQEANIIINELCKREASEFCDILNICLIARDGNLDECKITGNTAWIEGRV